MEAHRVWGGVTVRKYIAHDFDRYAVISAVADQQLVTYTPITGLSDVYHVQLRLASVRLEPKSHQVAGDSRWGLAAWGAELAAVN